MSQPHRKLPGARRCSIALLVASLAAPTVSLAQLPDPAAPTPSAPPTPGEMTPPGPRPTPGQRAGRIVYQVVPLASGSRGSVTTTLATVPVLASDGRPLLGVELYHQLGRPDLVAEYRAREARRGLWTGVGAAISVGGLVYAVTRPGPDASMSLDQFRRAARDQDAAQATGAVVSLAGAVVMMVAMFTDPNPVGETEIHHLIEEHNRALPATPGDRPPRAAAPPAGAGAARAAFQVGLLPGGGMAQVAVAF